MFKRIIKMKWLAVALVCVMVIPMALGCAAEEAAPAATVTVTPKAEVYTWRLQGQHPTEDERHMMLTRIADRLNVMSQGQINIDIYFINSLVPLAEIPEALNKGVIEMAHPCAGYYAGLDPVFDAGPGLWDLRDEWEFYEFMWEWGGGDIMRDAYEKLGVYYISVTQTSCPDQVYSKVPIRSVADFQGLKMRSFGQAAKFHDNLGAATIYLPGDEIVPALSTGVIDAAEYAHALSNYQMGFHEVTDYMIFPAFQFAVGACELLMQLELWNSLPEHLQMMIDSETREATEWVTRLYYENNALYTGKMLEEGPMEAIWLPESDYPIMVAAAEKVRDETAAKSPEAAKFVKALRDYMRELGYLE